MAKLTYKPGAVVLPAQHPVIATDRVDKFGNQICENTGLREGYRDCIVWKGMLYGADMAARLMEDSVRQAALELLAALEGVIEHAAPGKADDPMTFQRKLARHIEAVSAARAAIARAKGAL